MAAEPGALLLDLKDEEPERAVHLLPTRIDRLPGGQYAFASTAMPGVAIVAADLNYGLVSYEQLARAKREQLFHTLDQMQRSDQPLTLETIVIVPQPGSGSTGITYRVPLTITNLGADDWHAECKPLIMGYDYDTLAQAILRLSGQLVGVIRDHLVTSKPLPPEVYPLESAHLPHTFTITMIK